MAPAPPEVKEALKVMKSLGFAKNDVVRVLKRLLQVYDNNYDLIAEDNYRVLIESMLEEQDKAVGCNMEDGVVFDNIEQSGRRVRNSNEMSPSPCMLNYDNLGESSLKKPKLEAGNSQNRENRERNAEPSSPQVRDLGNATVPFLTKTSVSPKKLEQNILSTYRRETRDFAHACNNNAEPNLAFQKNAITNSSPKAEEIVPDDEMPNFEVPLSVICPPHHRILNANEGHQHHQNQKDSSLRSTSILQADDNDSEANKKTESNKDMAKGRQVATNISLENGKASAHATFKETSSATVDLASSDSGEVKLLLRFNSNRLKPSPNTVIKVMEDRALKSYKNLPPDFSLKKLLKEMCACVTELSPQTINTEHKNVGKLACALESKENEKEESSAKGKELEEQEVLNRNSLSLSVLNNLRPPHDPNDISKGEERVRISIVNEVSNEQCPSSFYYIQKNIIYQNAYVNISFARIGDEDCCSDCFGDCASAAIPCACARETGGEFAYTEDGILKGTFLDACVSMNSKPQKHHHVYCQDCPLERSNEGSVSNKCKGHLVRKFIKECWSKCGCNKQCTNRVVQRGISCNLQVFFTPEGKGWGLRTVDELPRGAFVCEYVGEILTNTELHNRTIQITGSAKHTYPVLLDADWGSEGVLKDEEALCLDATFYGNAARFVNHRCVDANMVEIPVEVETPDRHYYHLAFFTTRKIEQYEELTWDYGIDFDDVGHPIKAFKCRCGSKFCRDSKRSSDIDLEDVSLVDLGPEDQLV